MCFNNNFKIRTIVAEDNIRRKYYFKLFKSILVLVGLYK